MMFFPWDSKTFIFLGGGIFYFLLGLVDDRYNIPARLKFLMELLVTIVVVWQGIRNGLFLENPFGRVGAIPLLAYLSLPFSVLWIVGIANAVNLIDGLDGLAAGVVMIACVAMGVASLINPAVLLNPYTIILFGCMAGFIPYNLYPSKILMGDSGSLFIGYSVAIISLSSFANSDRSVFLSLIPPAMALFIPISDTMMAICRRSLKGVGIFSPDKGHFHHLLLRRGYSHPKAVWIVWGISAGFGSLSLILSKLIIKQIYLVLAMLFVAVVWAITSYGILAKYSPTEPPEHQHPYSQ